MRDLNDFIRIYNDEYIPGPKNQGNLLPSNAIRLDLVNLAKAILGTLEEINTQTTIKLTQIHKDLTKTF